MKSGMNKQMELNEEDTNLAGGDERGCTREQFGRILNEIFTENIMNGDDPEAEDDLDWPLIWQIYEDNDDDGSPFSSLPEMEIILSNCGWMP
jgi:hypothetical protein